VACRRKAEPRALLRVVRGVDGGLVVDWRRNLGGRGAHVCLDRSCIEAAVERRGFDRALKTHAKYPDAGELLDSVLRALERQVETLIGTAARSGRLAAGTDAVLKALERGEARCLLVAADAAARERLVSAAGSAAVACHVTGNKAKLGAIVGRGETGVLSIAGSGLAAAIDRVQESLASLGDESPRGDL
jgi:predicted RNA-binding protein YlxR (DUF448 family)